MKFLYNHKKYISVFLSFFLCFSLFFVSIINVRAEAAPELGEDPGTQEYNPDISLYEGKPNNQDWTSFSNIVSSLIVIACGTDLAYNVSDAAITSVENDEPFNWYRAFGSINYSSTPIYRVDSENQKLQRVDDVNEIFGTHIGELYIPSDQNINTYIPLFEEAYNDSSSIEIPSINSLSSDVIASYMADSDIDYSSYIYWPNSKNWDHTFASGCDTSAWGMKVVFRYLNNGILGCQFCDPISFDGSDYRYLSQSGFRLKSRNYARTDTYIKNGADGFLTGPGESDYDFSFYGNLIAYVQDGNGFNLFKYENGQLIATGFYEGNYDNTLHDDIFTPVSSESDIFSGISSAIGNATAAALAAADPIALNAARNAYTNSSKSDSDYQAFLASINAALAAQNAANAEVSQDVKGIAVGVSSIISLMQAIINAILAIPGQIVAAIKSLGVTITDIYNKLLSWDFATWFQDLINGVTEIPTKIIEWLTDFALELGENWESLFSNLDTIINTITSWSFSEWFDDLIDGVLAIPTSIITWLSDFNLDISDFWENIKAKIQSIIDTITSWSFFQWVQDIINAIASIPSAIADLFVMSEAQEAEVKEQLADVFSPFIWIKDFVHDFVITLKGILIPATEPPKIPIHLGNNTSKYNWGGDTYILDLTFWAAYKPFADAIIIFFAWAFYLWHLYKTLPSLFWGGNGIVSELQDSSIH